MNFNLIFIFLLLFFIGCSEELQGKSTDELFANYISLDTENKIPIDEYYGYFNKATLNDLKTNSFIPTRSLIVTLVNLSDSFEVDDRKFYKLIDLLLTKGESLAGLEDSECNFVDQLIMKGDVQLFKYLVSKGMKIPDNTNCTVEILNKYKFRYTSESYDSMLRELDQ